MSKENDFIKSLYKHKDAIEKIVDECPRLKLLCIDIIKGNINPKDLIIDDSNLGCFIKLKKSAN